MVFSIFLRLITMKVKIFLGYGGDVFRRSYFPLTGWLDFISYILFWCIFPLLSLSDSLLLFTAPGEPASTFSFRFFNLNSLYFIVTCIHLSIYVIYQGYMYIKDIYTCIHICIYFVSHQNIDALLLYLYSIFTSLYHYIYEL